MALKARSDCYLPPSNERRIWESVPSRENMWNKLVSCKFKYTKNFEAWFRRPVIHENDNRGAYLTLKYRRVSWVQCSAAGENEMESRSIPSLENVSLASLITRGNAFWAKWIMFFLSNVISGENEMESRSIPSLENMSLVPWMTRGNGLWTKWILFFLSIAISERKRQNKQKEIKRGTNLIIVVYSPDRKSERIHVQ